jgi:hypothetical protein
MPSPSAPDDWQSNAALDENLWNRGGSPLGATLHLTHTQLERPEGTATAAANPRTVTLLPGPERLRPGENLLAAALYNAPARKTLGDSVFDAALEGLGRP